MGGAGLFAYQNAHLLWILPHSLITVSLATAMLPNASRLASAGNLEGVTEETTKTMRLALVALVPATVGFIALSGPITQLLFGNGQGARDSKWVALTLVAFAVGLVPFTVQFVCLRTYYAIENTRTPFLLQCIIASVNALAALLLVWWVSDPNLYSAALAMSYSIAYVVGVLVSWQFLKRHIPGLDGGAMVLHIVRLALGAALGGVIAYLAARGILAALPGSKLGTLLSVVAGLVIIGLFYVGVGKLLQVRELGSLTDLIRARFSRGGKNTPAVVGADTGTLTPDAAAVTSGALAEDLMPTQLQPAITIEDGMEGAADDIDPESVVETRIRPAITTDDEDPEDPSGSVADDAADTGQESVAAVPPVLPLGEAGKLLGTRYRLDECLASRHGIESWRAHDLQLSRDVLAHVLPAGDARIPTVLDAARTGAAATDSRFLRVLDAVSLHEDGDVGAYVVCEFAAGSALSQLLGSMQLSTLEAAWIVRELADALSAMHTNGLFHEQLTPENVVITTSGAVRLIGFGVESVLGEGERATSWSAKEAGDVTALAALLYALLTNHWPGHAAWNLPAAPVVTGRLVGPHRLRADVPSSLDRICTSILSGDVPSDEPRISTASQLAAALSSVLGTANPTPDLEDRIRFGTSPGEALHSPTGGHIAAAAITSSVPSVHQSMHHQTLAEMAVDGFDEQETVENPLDLQRRLQPTTRPILWIILALAVGTLVVSLGALAANRSGDEAGPGTSTSPSTSVQPSGNELQIVGGVDFDPEADGGNAEENTSQVPLAFDGDPETGWSTVSYHNRPNLGGLKPGVGIVLDLGEKSTISSVDVQFSAPGTSLEIRVPTDENATAAPLTTQAEWRVVASQAKAEASTTLTLEEPASSRFLLVYLTELPQISTARFQSQITNVVVHD
ncbi:MAG: lipid II flippase MurJ, partial [Luteococcus japonicus]